MEFERPDFSLAAAEIFVAVMALVVMVTGTFLRRISRELGYALAQITVIGAAFITVFSVNEPTVRYTFGTMYVSDWLGQVLKLFIYLSVFASLLYGRLYLIERRLEKAEYYVLMLLSMLGAMILVSANNLLVLYLGLEMMTLALYALVAFDRDNGLRSEAAIKYFVLGAISSGLLLYGMSMIYGATGSLDLGTVAQAVYLGAGDEMVLKFGVAFLVAGIAFKFGVVPFHMWVPDVYHGAATPVTLLIASAPKLAGVALALRLLVGGFFGLAETWQPMLMLLAVASIVLGNLAAIVQNNIKRMLAYSGISHMGFVLLGLLAGVTDGSHQLAFNAYSSALFYAVSYALMSLASFGMVLLLARTGFEAEHIDDFKGLNRRSPWFAAMMLFVMFSMAGIPFFLGFFAKFAVLEAVVAAGHTWLAVLAVIMSVIGAYYYLRVVKVMYFDEPTDRTALIASSETRVLLSANALTLAVAGLMPQGLMSICAYAILTSF